MGPIVFFLSVLPAATEAIVTANVSRVLFEMPSKLSYTLGFLLASAGTTVIIPSIYALQVRGYKVRKTIVNLMIICTTIDNLWTGTLFAVLRSSYTSDVSDSLANSS